LTQRLADPNRSSRTFIVGISGGIAALAFAVQVLLLPLLANALRCYLQGTTWSLTVLASIVFVFGIRLPATLWFSQYILSSIEYQAWRATFQKDWQRKRYTLWRLLYWCLSTGERRCYQFFNWAHLTFTPLLIFLMAFLPIGYLGLLLYFSFASASWVNSCLPKPINPPQWQCYTSDNATCSGNIPCVKNCP